MIKQSDRSDGSIEFSLVRKRNEKGKWSDRPDGRRSWGGKVLMILKLGCRGSEGEQTLGESEVTYVGI